jgi:hypothetical protein
MPSLNDSIIVQVCGEFIREGAEPRAFIQNVVLASQGPRKYYIAHDMIEWLNDLYPKMKDLQVSDSIKFNGHPQKHEPESQPSYPPQDPHRHRQLNGPDGQPEFLQKIMKQAASEQQKREEYSALNPADVFPKPADEHYGTKVGVSNYILKKTLSFSGSTTAQASTGQAREHHRVHPARTTTASCTTTNRRGYGTAYLG